MNDYDKFLIEEARKYKSVEEFIKSNIQDKVNHYIRNKQINIEDVLKDKHGNPIILFHGSTNTFNKFKCPFCKELGYKDTFWFTPDLESALYFTGKRAGGTGEYLHIIFAKNIKNIEKNGTSNLYLTDIFDSSISYKENGDIANVVLTNNNQIIKLDIIDIFNLKEIYNQAHNKEMKIKSFRSFKF